jgi:hypothetical protein
MIYFDPALTPVGVSSPAALEGFPDINGIDASPQSSVKSSGTGLYTYTMITTLIGVNAVTAEKIVLMGVPEAVYINKNITIITKLSGGIQLEILSPLPDVAGAKKDFWISSATGEIVKTEYRNLVFTPTIGGIGSIVIQFSTKIGGLATAAEFGKVCIFKQKYEFVRNSDTTDTTDGYTVMRKISAFDTGAESYSYVGEVYNFAASVKGCLLEQCQKMRELAANYVCFLPDGETGRIFYGHIIATTPTRAGAGLYNQAINFSSVI